MRNHSSARVVTAIALAIGLSVANAVPTLWHRRVAARRRQNQHPLRAHVSTYTRIHEFTCVD
jgi:hypothetical protein